MRGDVLDPPEAPPRIDARLRARRIEVRRSEGRRRLRRLVAAVVITLVAAAAWGVTRSPLLDVDRIVVHGAVHTGVDQIADVSGIRVHDALVDVDAGSAADAISGLPWVAEAEVRRSWRGVVSIEVVERTAVAVLADPAGGAARLVDGEGWVVASAPESHQLPVVEGLVAPAPGERLDPVPSALLELIGAMPAPVRDLTEAVEVDDAEIWLRLHRRPGEVAADGSPRSDGGRVRFGDGRAVEDQMLAAATVLARVDLTDLEVLDVRVPSSPTVTRVVPDEVVDAEAGDGEDAAR